MGGVNGAHRGQNKDDNLEVTKKEDNYRMVKLMRNAI